MRRNIKPLFINSRFHVKGIEHRFFKIHSGLNFCCRIQIVLKVIYLNIKPAGNVIRNDVFNGNKGGIFRISVIFQFWNKPVVKGNGIEQEACFVEPVHKGAFVGFAHNHQFIVFSSINISDKREWSSSRPLLPQIVNKTSVAVKAQHNVVKEKAVFQVVFLSFRGKSVYRIETFF